VRLTANGKSHSEKVTVANDPRSPVNLAALKAQDALIRKLSAAERLGWTAFQQTDTARTQLRTLTGSDSTSAAAKAIREYIAKLDTLGGMPAGGGFNFGGAGFGARARPTLVQLVNGFLSQLNTFENGDVAPTAAMLAAYQSACNDLGKSIIAWRAINGTDLSALNAALAGAGKSPFAKAVGVEAPACAP
jgi:hypothetical protein